MARVYLKGLPELKRKLIALKEQTAEDIKPALAAAAQDIVDLMKRQVPVETGALRDSIGWTFGDRPKYSQVVSQSQVGDLVVTIFAGNTNVRYAHLVEFGTAPHTVGGLYAGAHHPGSKAKPFFYPSYRAMKKDVRRRINKAIREAVQKVAAS